MSELGLRHLEREQRDRHAVLDICEGLWAEFAHYCAFADAHDAMALPGEKKLNPHDVKQSWKEDLDLSHLRFRHKKENPKLGERATRFTEGGYCTLFSEGMKLRSRGGDRGLGGLVLNRDGGSLPASRRGGSPCSSP